MTVELYMDETGTHDATGKRPGAEVAGVVGYLSGSDSWGAFSSQWKAVLDEYHIPAFHGADLAEDRRRDPESPYLGWPQAKLDRFMVKLAEIARDQTIVGVGGLVDVAEFNEVVAPVLPDSLRHPYYACFPLCMKRLITAIKQEFPLPARETILLFMDQQEEFKPLTLKLYDDFLRTFDPERRLFGDITWGSKEDYLPLQAADLLAGRARKVVTRTVQGKQPVSPGSWDEVLAAANTLRMGHHDRETLPKIRDHILTLVKGRERGRDENGSKSLPSE